jgi:hypothetical protein
MKLFGKSSFKMRISPEDPITTHEFKHPSDMEALNVKPTYIQFFDEANSTTDENAQEFETLPKLNNSALMLDMVRYALLNTKKRRFMTLWGNKLKEKETPQLQSPVLDNADINPITKRLYDELKINDTLLVSKENLGSLLFYAARYGDIIALRDVLKAKVDVNMRDDIGPLATT